MKLHLFNQIDLRKWSSTVYLNRDFVGQAVLRFAVTILHLPALLVPFF